MTPLDQALAYARRGWPVFPCRDKTCPLVKWGAAATTDERQIIDWWHRLPRAEIGLPTGHQFAVLDVDVKERPTGLDTLEQLGFPFWFETPTAHSPSGGLHAYFRPAGEPIRNTAGKRGRGIGPQLDWRGIGGYIVAPSPGSAYRWDPVLGLDMPFAEAPTALLPRDPVRIAPQRPIRSVPGLDRYGEAALDDACRAIIGAPNGEQETTLNGECFAIGTLAAAGALPADFARDVLRWAARQLPIYDSHRPWHPDELDRKVQAALEAGLRHPREAKHA